MSLFDEPGVPPDPLATIEQVAHLKLYGYRPEVVRKWTRERAASVLGRIRRDEKATRRRATSMALLADVSDGAERPGASLVERQCAADYLAQALEAGAEDIYLAIA